jgi:hypothetical protein
MGTGEKDGVSLYLLATMWSSLNHSPASTISLVGILRERRSAVTLVVWIGLVESDHLGQVSALMPSHDEAALLEDLDQVGVLEVAHVVRLVVVGREAPADMVALGEVAPANDKTKIMPQPPLGTATAHIVYTGTHSSLLGPPHKLALSLARWGAGV